MKRIATLLAAALLLAGTARAAQLGPEMVQDGRFDTGTPWSLGTNWQITPGPDPQGVAFHNEGASSAIFQPATALTGGATYRVVYTVSNTATSSDPRHWFRLRGDTAVVSPLASGAGTFTFDIVAPANPTTMGLAAVYGCACVVTEVSVRELLP